MIGRHPIHRHKMSVVEDEAKGRHARTDWQVVERYDKAFSLLRCQIHTGRTHQIRVHLSSLRHPLMGDSIYGYRPDHRLNQEPARTMLHAARLKLNHPVTGVAMDLVAPIPSDFREQIDQLRVLFPTRR
jgi:23S rRNA pseudouridine1911/1915/1917 synthase